MAQKTTKQAKGLSKEEVAAMKERIKELNTDEIEGDNTVLKKIATMPEPDRALGKRLHIIIKASAPALTSRLWYGMPAYAKDGNVVCFFQPAYKFKSRYAMLGFSDKAGLDEGHVWPVYFAVKELTAADEANISALIKKAVGR